MARYTSRKYALLFLLILYMLLLINLFSLNTIALGCAAAIIWILFKKSSLQSFRFVIHRISDFSITEFFNIELNSPPVVFFLFKGFTLIVSVLIGSIFYKLLLQIFGGILISSLTHKDNHLRLAAGLLPKYLHTFSGSFFRH